MYSYLLSIYLVLDVYWYTVVGHYVCVHTRFTYISMKQGTTILKHFFKTMFINLRMLNTCDSTE